MLYILNIKVKNLHKEIFKVFYGVLKIQLAIHLVQTLATKNWVGMLFISRFISFLCCSCCSVNIFFLLLLLLFGIETFSLTLCCSPIFFSRLFVCSFYGILSQLKCCQIPAMFKFMLFYAGYTCKQYSTRLLY